MKHLMQKIIILFLLSYVHNNHAMIKNRDYFGNFLIKQAVGIICSKLIEDKLDGELYLKAYALSIPDLTVALVTEPDENYMRYVKLWSLSIALSQEISLATKIIKNIVTGQDVFSDNNKTLSKAIMIQLFLTGSVHLLQTATVLFADTVIK